MKLKIGDILEFEGGRTYSAEKGAKALFKKYCKGHSGEEYIKVEWIRDELSGDQQDGNYYEYMFTKVGEVFDQKEDRIFEENKKVMKVDFKAGKERVVQRLISFIENFEQDMLQDIKNIATREDTVLGNDTGEIEDIIECIRDHQKYTQLAIDNLRYANSLFEIMQALKMTVFEEDEATILQAFLGVDSVTID